MAGKVEGKVAIVTGAARGVGRCIALLLAEQGAKVVIADNGSQVDGSGSSSEPAERVVKEITDAGGTAMAIACDVSCWDDAKAMIDDTVSAFGKLDILVKVAGNFRVNTVASITRDDWDALRKVHMDGMMHTSHFAALHWKDHGGYGRLINFTSDSAMSGVPDTFGYAAAKGAVLSMTRAIANAMISYGVTANCMTQASMTRMADSYYPAADVKPSDAAPPEQRPDTVACLVLYLASPEAAGISGRNFGSYGYKYIRWNEPRHERTLESRDNGPWDVDYVFENFAATLGDGLDLKKDLPWAMESLDQQAGTADINDLK
ncbi:MAG: SDR family oxidoreductase [Gammaproteobacteria bacterium]|nr:SDR family oxidoreductase [Gammaproteobacteria bacterium]